LTEPVESEAIDERVAGPGPIRSAVAAALPASLRGARIDPGRRGVLVLAVIALVAAAVAGVSAWRARPTPEPLAAPVPAEVAVSPSTGPLLVVAVAGKVRRPGVVRLPAGSRVADAIAAAGGAVPGAELGLVNLARKVVDGEQVVVGVPAPAGVAPAGAGPQAPGALLDLNTATVAQFDTLPGVGPVLAQRLVDYRTANGGFRSVDQLREVDGIGESRFQKLKALVTV
jgi:competence protein ComEA